MLVAGAILICLLSVVAGVLVFVRIRAHVRLGNAGKDWERSQHRLNQSIAAFSDAVASMKREASTLVSALDSRRPTDLHKGIESTRTEFCPHCGSSTFSTSESTYVGGSLAWNVHTSPLTEYGLRQPGVAMWIYRLSEQHDVHLDEGEQAGILGTYDDLVIGDVSEGWGSGGHGNLFVYPHTQRGRSLAGRVAS